MGYVRSVRLGAYASEVGVAQCRPCVLRSSPFWLPFIVAILVVIHYRHCSEILFLTSDVRARLCWRVIDLNGVFAVLDEANALADALHGLALDESDAVTSQSKGEARRVRAQRSQDLQLLASRLELAGALVRNEYWYARGLSDPVRPDRER